MRPVRTIVSSFALLTGLAVVLIAGSGAFAAPSDQTVCGMRADGPKTYGSAREAKADKARVMHPGGCDTALCMGMWSKAVLAATDKPASAICGLDPLTHQRMTYPDKCAIESAGGTWVHAGPCK